MYLLAAYLILLTSHVVRSGEQTEHRDFQYNSVVDPLTGRYNFAYDTGNDNEIAHSMHMQYRDANGLVRGRYGYTDPNGKLRVVEYEAGPKGFVARGDVGPDQSLHEQTPETQGPQLASYTQEDVQLDPRPVQMSGWDPMQNPMGQPIAEVGSPVQDSNGRTDSGMDGYWTANNTGADGGDVYIPVIDPYDERYPRISFSNENSAGRELEYLSSQPSVNDTDADMVQEENPVAVPVTVNNIDVNPDEIRQAASGQAPVARSADGGQTTVARSADGDSSRSSRSSLPYSYRNYRRSSHDHSGEIAYPYRSVYIPSHGHYHYTRQPHDHEAEKRYYPVNRYTHDHDAEKRYYVSRYNHDHDAERRYYNNRRYTHDHDAERRYYSNRQTHDHDAEKYQDTVYHQNNPNRRRIYYRDSHSQQPHEHYSDIYHNTNDRSHQHSDVHLYGTRSQSLQVPPTAKPGDLKYIYSDKYHDKYYYWTD